MRKLLLPLGLAAIWLSPVSFHPSAQAQTAPVLTLDQARELAASRSFALAAARRQVDATEGALRQAGAGPNPRFNALVEDTRGATRTTTATLDFPIELGGKRAARIGVAARARELALAELGHVQATLRADVARLFFAVLLAQERAALATGSADLATRAARAVARRVAAGKSSPVDETRARVDEANARLEANDAATELLMARGALAALWGDAGASFTQAIGDVEPASVPAVADDPIADLDAAPGLLASRVEIERRLALVDVERGKGVPDLTLSVGARRDNELGRTQAVVGLSIPLPFFDRNEGAIHEAASLAEKAREDHQALRARTAMELRQASLQLEAAGASARTLKETVLPAARQAFDAATQGFEAGKFGFLDVIDAQRALLQARARHLGALAAAHQAATTIDRLLGR